MLYGIPDWLWALLIVLAAVGLAQKLLAKKSRRLNNYDPIKFDPPADGKVPKYEMKGDLFSAAEKSFFQVLICALPPGCYVFAKVRLSDLVTPKSGISRSVWQSQFNRILMKHVDFVLCGAEPLTVLGVIELDDRSHATLGAGVKDDLKDAALRSAKIPILRVTARRTYSGAYNRENSNRSAEFIYNHIQCAPMLIWLNEATGAPARELKRAIKLALVAKSGAGECAAIRKIFPWERVVKILVR